MFCKNCGAAIEDGTKFCANCGADQTSVPTQAVSEEPIQQETPTKSGFDQTLSNVKEGATEAINKAADFSKDYIEAAKKDKKKLIILIAAGVAVLALVIALISLLFSAPYKSAIDNYMNIVNGKITEKTIEKLYPEAFWDEQDVDIDDLVDFLEESYEENLEEMEDEYGKNVKTSYKITDKDKLDKDDLDDLREKLNESWGVKRKSITQAYELELEMTIKGSEDKEVNELEDVIVVKIDGKWYVAEGMGF